MTKSLEKLWEGQISPIELFEKNNSRLSELEALLLENLEKLEKLIGKSESERLLRIANNCIGEASKQAFADGFSLGLKITAESIFNAENTHY